MQLDESTLDFLESQIPLLASGASHQAYLETLSNGQSVLEVQNDFLVRTHPNGHQEILRAIQPGLSVQPGTRYKLT